MGVLDPRTTREPAVARRQGRQFLVSFRQRRQNCSNRSPPCLRKMPQEKLFASNRASRDVACDSRSRPRRSMARQGDERNPRVDPSRPGFVVLGHVRDELGCIDTAGRASSRPARAIAGDRKELVHRPPASRPRARPADQPRFRPTSWARDPRHPHHRRSSAGLRRGSSAYRFHHAEGYRRRLPGSPLRPAASSMSSARRGTRPTIRPRSRPPARHAAIVKAGNMVSASISSRASRKEWRARWGPSSTSRSSSCITATSATRRPALRSLARPPLQAATLR